MRVLLIQLPFFTLDSPNIGLSLLRAALEAADIECDLEYMNLDYGDRIGFELYSWIAGTAPVHLLLGDLIFAQALHGVPVSAGQLRELVHGGEPDGGKSDVPDSIVEAFDDLVAVAGEFVHDQVRGTDWERYDLVGFGTMFTIAPVLAMTKAMKASCHDPPPVVLGGSYCEDEMGEQLIHSFGDIDFICRGEGEGVIVELARRLGTGTSSFSGIPGLVWRDSDERVHANGSAAALYPGKASLVELGGRLDEADAGRPTYDLDALAPPHYDDWFAQIRDKQVIEDKPLRLPIQTSRGCWYGEKHHCTFCGLNDSTIGYRRKSAARALEEFSNLAGYGVKIVHAVDDILDYRHLKTMLPGLVEMNLDLEIFYEIKANLNLDQVRLLHDSGIVWLQPGIESLSTPMLELMDKGVSAFQNVRLLRYTAEVGIGVAWHLLYGLPGEDPEEFERMASLLPALTHLQPPYIGCTQVRVHRFSPLYVQAEEVGLTDIEPTPSHQVVFPFEPAVVSKLAYYFDHRFVSQQEPHNYIGRLAAALHDWHTQVGRAAFLSLDCGDATRLIDTRPGAIVSRAVLGGLEREVFEGCVHGSTCRKLARDLGAHETRVAEILDHFVDRRWALHLDNKYLTLAVPMDRWVSREARYMPPAMLDRQLLGLYGPWMARLHQGERKAPSVGAFARLASSAGASRSRTA